MIHLAVFLLLGSTLAPTEQATAEPATAQAAAAQPAAAQPTTTPGVRAIGVYPLLLPGLQAVPAGRPRVRLWCQGSRLLGVMVPDESPQKAAPTAQGRSLPSALLLRDGRCQADGGGVSFGFLVPMRVWIFDSGARTAPEERTTWLLHRFQGTVTDGHLEGVLVQVDVNHPGFAFPESKVEVEALGEDQASFADEKAWLEDLGRTFSVVRSEP